MLLTHNNYVVQDLTLSPDKIKSIWRMLKRSRTLFSDLTINDVPNFVAAVTSSNSMWFEVRQNGVVIGIVSFGEMHQVTDCLGHMVFFDRRPAAKKELCVLIVKWMFNNFPLERMSVHVPQLYTRTVDLMRSMGFTTEGKKRRASLIGGKWWDHVMYGITRKEVEAL